jgi:hypothetical protein
MRAAALASVGFSVVLMLMFGWQGATCIDECTMAASNVAMGATLMLAGGGAFSIDNALLRHWPALAGQSWFRWMGGAMPLPLPDRGFRTLALAVFGTTVVFNVATYNYYRGSVVTAFHGGPVSPAKHHLALADGAVLPDGSVRFHAYLNGHACSTLKHHDCDARGARRSCAGAVGRRSAKPPAARQHRKRVRLQSVRA